jgi:hypothetical protein
MMGITNKGMLSTDDSGRAFRSDPNGPISVDFGHGVKSEGLGGGVKGIGGTEVSADSEDWQGSNVPNAPRPSAPKTLTPEMMMALANKMEQDLMERTKASEGTTEVDSALIRSGGNPYGGTVTPDAPDWLVQYMEGVPNAGESQYGGPALDRVKAKTYLSQQEMLRHLKSKR